MPEVNPNQNLEQVDQIDQQPEQQVSAAEVQAEALTRADQTVASAERLASLADSPEQDERAQRIDANRRARIMAEDLDAKTYEVAMEYINNLDATQKALIERTVQVTPGRMEASNGTVKIALVMRFQEINGLEPSGIIDQTTNEIMARLIREESETHYASAREAIQQTSLGGLNFEQGPDVTITQPTVVAANEPSVRPPLSATPPPPPAPDPLFTRRPIEGGMIVSQTPVPPEPVTPAPRQESVQISYRPTPEPIVTEVGTIDEPVTERPYMGGAAGTPSRETVERAEILRNTPFAGLDLTQGPDPIQPADIK